MLVQFSTYVYVFFGLFKLKNIFTKEKKKRGKIFFNMPVIVFIYNLSVYRCIIWLSPNPESWTDHLFINLKFPARLNSLNLSKLFTWRTEMIDLAAVAMIYSVSYFVLALSFLFRNTTKWEVMKHYLYINKISTIDPFTITAVLHSSGTFVSGKMTISQTNHDAINAFNCSMTSFYRKGYYYH